MSAEASVHHNDMHDELVARTQLLIPSLLERAPEAEQLRRVPDATIADIRSAGLIRTLRPAHYEGYEQDYRTFSHVVRELGRGCASTGWCGAAWLSMPFILTQFPVQAQDDVCLADPDAFIASTGVPSGTAEPVDGGWLVNGRWGFASGVHATSWMTASVVGPGSQLFSALMPTSELEVLDTWRSMGLRATGSTDTVAKDLFVPSHRVIDGTTYIFTEHGPRSSRVQWRTSAPYPPC